MAKKKSAAKRTTKKATDNRLDILWARSERDRLKGKLAELGEDALDRGEIQTAIDDYDNFLVNYE